MNVMKQLECIKIEQKVIIFGTGIIADCFYRMFRQVCPLCEVKYFMVSNVSSQSEFMGVPVISVVNAPQYIHQNLVLVATSEKYYSEVAELLSKYGFTNIISASFESELNALIREKYLQQHFKKLHRNYIRIEDILIQSHGDKVHYNRFLTCELYQVKSHLDSSQVVVPECYHYERMIQAGAELTDKRVVSEDGVCDNIGDNISEKNPRYCELTALYWIWKHATADYIGLCHYRRHFMLNEEQLKLLSEQHCDVDVVLTTPIVNFPSVRAIYEHDHIIEDWDIMMEAISELAPDYLESAHEIEVGIFYCGYNMLIARKIIFDDYCRWLFPILKYCEEHCLKKEDRYQGRYIGFLAERLLTIYFWHNWERYRIVFVNKEFISHL